MAHDSVLFDITTGLIAAVITGAPNEGHSNPGGSLAFCPDLAMGTASPGWRARLFAPLFI